MLEVLIYLVVVMLVVGLLMWLIDYIPIQAPLNRWAKIVVVVIAALVIIMTLLNLTGVDTGLPRR
jgi:hypothetical protein